VGVEPTNGGFANRCHTPENIGKTAFPDAVGANEAAQETKLERLSPDLQALIDAWPALPDAIKAGILAMVRAAGGGQGR